ncbi:MAG: hypothetical protein ABGX83_01170 [Nitrospira sp.]|nr:hypothetical protein [Candidatus Manganitrophaceae bacterium]HIL35166.1 hypothetical protein [Candidatus Manganitrophaceae bacterium]
MNKFLLISLIGAVLSIPSIARPATIGNIAGMQVTSGRYSLGIEHDSVANRDMAFDEGSAFTVDSFGIQPALFPDPLIPGGRISDVEIKSNRVLLRGTWSPMSRLDFFVKLGIADVELNYTIKSPTQTDKHIKYDGSIGVAYGVGLKGEITNWRSWAVISEFQFLRYEVEGDFTIDGQDLAALLLPNLNPMRSGSKAEIQELQLAVYITGKIGMMTPYGGFKISDLSMDVNSEVTGRDGITGFSTTESRRETHESLDRVGVFLGTGIEMNGPWTANIEFRFIDETAVSIGINRRF